MEINVDKYQDEIINNTAKLIAIPSKLEKSDNPEEPFGKPINDALKFMLDLGESLGFNVKNLDGYCGYIEFGSRRKINWYYNTSGCSSRRL